MKINSINQINFNQNKNFKSAIKQNNLKSFNNFTYNSSLNALANYSKGAISFRGNFATAQEIKDYIEEHPNEDLKQIAQHFETSVSYIKALLNIKPPQKKYASLPITRENTLAYLKKHENASVEELAQYFNVSTTYINAFLKKFNFSESELATKSSETETANSIKPKKVPQDALKQYILDNPNATQSQIAEHFGVTKVYIGRLITEYNIPYENKVRQPSITKEMLENYIKTHPKATQKEIGEYFGIESFNVSKLIGDYGISYEIKKNPIRQTQPAISQQELESYVETHPQASQGQIAKHFNVERAQVSLLIKKYDIPYEIKKQIATVDKEELKDYVETHTEESLNDIGNHFNLTAAYIGHLIKIYDIPYQSKSKPRRVYISKQELESYIKVHPEESQAQIAKHFNTSSTAINAYIRKYEIPYTSKRK